MAGEEKVVLGRDGERVAHECCGVDDEGAGHGAGNAVRSSSVFDSIGSMGKASWNMDAVGIEERKIISHFRVFLNVHNGSDGDTEIRGWAPEIWTK
jgi:hypothetical protein